jgi:hypothetical protein
VDIDDLVEGDPPAEQSVVQHGRAVLDGGVEDAHRDRRHGQSVSDPHVRRVEVSSDQGETVAADAVAAAREADGRRSRGA